MFLCLIPFSAHAITARDAYAAARESYVIGTTPDEVQANFADKMIANLSRPSAAKALGRMTASEFQMMTLHLIWSGKWLEFRTQVIETYAPQYFEAYETIVASTGAEFGGRNPHPLDLPLYYEENLHQKLPALSMTLTEVWLEFRTNPALAAADGELTGIAATGAYTVAWSYGWLYGAWYAGQTVGGAISWGMQTYAPDWYADVLGKDIAAIATASLSTLDTLTQVAIYNFSTLANLCTPGDLNSQPCIN